MSFLHLLCLSEIHISYSTHKSIQIYKKYSYNNIVSERFLPLIPEQPLRIVPVPLNVKKRSPKSSRNASFFKGVFLEISMVLAKIVQKKSSRNSSFVPHSDRLSNKRRGSNGCRRFEQCKQRECAEKPKVWKIG